MHFVGELHCICCGYVAGEIDGDRNKPFTAARLTPALNGPGLITRLGDRPRCGRCGGRLLIESRDDFVRGTGGSSTNDSPGLRNEPLAAVPVPA
jgi:hypothetical protein